MKFSSTGQKLLNTQLLQIENESFFFLFCFTFYVIAYSINIIFLF